MISGTSQGSGERAQLYNLLSMIFYQPLDASRLERLRAPQMLAAMSAAGISPGEDFTASSIKELQDRLAIDFTQLFHGPGEHIVPYEGIQLDEDDELMGGAAARVRQFMAEVGFTVPPQNGEMPDHVSVELAFMGELARREAEALNSGDHKTAEQALSIQQQFLAAHLGRWTTSFARRIEDRAQTSFYAAMAKMLNGFIASERNAVVV